MQLTNSPIPEEGIRKRDAFVLKLMQALHLFGTPSHRLEQAMDDIANTLNMKLQCLATPTSVTLAIGELEDQRTFLLRVEPSEANLEKLADLQNVMQQVGRGELSLGDARTSIDEIVARQPPFGALLTTFAFVVVSVCVALLFSGSLFDAAIAGFIGLPIGLLTVVSIKRPRVSMLLPALAAVVAALLARGASILHPELHPMLITIAAIIVLIPGLSLTMGINELAHKHLVSGTARLMGSLVVLLQLALGAAAGWGILENYFGSFVATPTINASALTINLAIAAVAVGFTILFHARWTDYWAILLGGTVAYWSTRFGTELFSPEFGAALGAWSIGCLANLLARFRDKPALTTLLPGILLLVPGSVGFRSLQAVMNDDLLTGGEAALTVFTVAIALVIGLFLSNLTVAPRKIL